MNTIGLRSSPKVFFTVLPKRLVEMKKTFIIDLLGYWADYHQRKESISGQTGQSIFASVVEKGKVGDYQKANIFFQPIPIAFGVGSHMDGVRAIHSIILEKPIPIQQMLAQFYINQMDMGKISDEFGYSKRTGYRKLMDCHRSVIRSWNLKVGTINASGNPIWQSVNQKYGFLQ